MKQTDVVTSSDINHKTSWIFSNLKTKRTVEKIFFLNQHVVFKMSFEVVRRLSVELYIFSWIWWCVVYRMVFQTLSEVRQWSGVQGENKDFVLLHLYGRLARWSPG